MASLRTLRPDAYHTAAAFVRWLQAQGVRVTVSSTRRDQAEQKRLWDCYRTTGCSNCRRGPGCYPAAPPGQSMHALGIAFDLHLDPPVYDGAGRAWERAGYTWGGRFADRIHFDMRPFGSHG